MDSVERAEILFAQLEVLLAQGQLEAARDLSLRLRSHLRRTGVEVVPDSAVPASERSEILEPLSSLLRQQSALVRDIRDASLQAEEAVAEGGPSAVDTLELGTTLEQAVEEIFYELDRLAEPLDELAADRLRTEVGQATARLRKAIRSGRLAPVKDALQRMRRLVEGLATDPVAGTRLDRMLEGFIGHLDPTGLRGVCEQLGDRQGRLTERTHVPTGAAESGGANGSSLADNLADARASMKQAHEFLMRRDLERAMEPARTAARDLGAALRSVDEALGSSTWNNLAAVGFLSPFVAGRKPEWELPAALGLRFHEELGALPQDHPERAELTRVVRILMDQDQADARVRFRQGSSDQTEAVQRIEVRVIPPWREDGARYLILLRYEAGAQGALLPTPSRPLGVLPTLGGQAELLFTAALEDCSLEVLRVQDQGTGPRLGYIEEDAGLSIRGLVDLNIQQQFSLEETIPSPVRGIVLGWLDSLEGGGELPVPEDVLRALGIPWYDVGDLVDRIRPVQEQLVFDLLKNEAEGNDFPGLGWLDENTQAFFQPSWGPDGQSPRVATPTSLIRYLAWFAKRNTKNSEAPSFSQLLAALQLHLGLKLAFYDDLEPERTRPWVHRAARALEQAFLQSQGLEPTAARAPFTQLAMRYASGKDAERSESRWDRWSRHAENLFEARAGEDLVRGGRLPSSAVFGSLRGTLATSLQEQGELAAAHSALAFGNLRDAAILFGNLVVDPASGEGVLIAGDSKLGKSSITARLVAGSPGRGVPGWPFGSSDRVLVMIPKPGEGPDGSDRALAAASPAHRSFGQWTEELWYRDGDKRQVKPSDHVVSRSLLPLRSIVFVHRESGEVRSPGLRPLTVANLVEDFQKRFGFTASRRFWRELFHSVSLLDISLRHRGADSFYEAAQAIRKHMDRAEAQRGLGTPRMMIAEDEEAWFGVSSAWERIRVTRVGRDGLDVDYLMQPDGTVSAFPSQLGEEIPLGRPRGFQLGDLGKIVPLDTFRLEQLFGQPHYQLTPTRLMPLGEEYYRSTMSGPCFFVPDLPLAAQQAVLRIMSREDSDRWKGYLEHA